jgi:hypothetical protein
MPTPTDKDACDLLDADHIAVKHLFVDYARLAYGSPPGGADGDKLSLARRICNALTMHAQIEEEIFYPALRKAIDQPGLLDEAEAEHQEAKELIAQIVAQAGIRRLDAITPPLPWPAVPPGTSRVAAAAAAARSAA